MIHESCESPIRIVCGAPCHKVGSFCCGPFHTIDINRRMPGKSVYVRSNWLIMKCKFVHAVILMHAHCLPKASWDTSINNQSVTCAH